MLKKQRIIVLTAMLLVSLLTTKLSQTIPMADQEASVVTRTLVSTHNRAFGEGSLIKNFDKNSKEVKPYGQALFDVVQNAKDIQKKNKNSVLLDSANTLALEEYNLLLNSLTKLSNLNKKELTADSIKDINKEIRSLQSAKTSIAAVDLNLKGEEQRKNITAQEQKLLSELNLIARELEATIDKAIKEAQALLKKQQPVTIGSQRSQIGA